MTSRQQDVPGECNALLSLGDDWGDNSCTIRCELPEGHEGVHQEQCRKDAKRPGPRHVCIQWEGDERITDIWSRWRTFLWEQLGEPDDWDWSDMPEDWDWEYHVQVLDGIKLT